MCDMCGTGTGPCKEQTANVAVAGLVTQMRVFIRQMEELQVILDDLRQKLRDLDE